MLQERVIVTKKGFKVSKDPAAQERRAFYTVFSLADAKVDYSTLKPVEYWNVQFSHEAVIAKGHFVVIIEKQGDNIIEEATIFIPHEMAKPKLSWRIKRNMFFGKSACLITIEWLEGKGEAIHRSHIWLKEHTKGRKFTFLKEQIKPSTASKGKQKDQYVIQLPADVRVESLSIEVDELVREKYALIV